MTSWSLPQPLLDRGFALRPAEATDREAYHLVKRCCYAAYVAEYFGGWDEDGQRRRSTAAFAQDLKRTGCLALLLHGHAVGFFTWDDRGDRIDGLTIQLLESARGQGIGSWYLTQITELAADRKKAAYLQVFRSNRAQALYQRFGFQTCGQSYAHVHMCYVPPGLEQSGGAV